MTFTLNESANQRVRIEVSSPSSNDSRDDGYVSLRVEDETSGEVLVSVEIPAGRWWRLCQSSVQTWPAFVSPHLDRVGKRLLTATVNIPAPLDGDTPKDQHRDVTKAVWEQLDREWHDFDEASTRKTNQGWIAVVRRWVDTDINPHAEDL